MYGCAVSIYVLYECVCVCVCVCVCLSVFPLVLARRFPAMATLALTALVSSLGNRADDMRRETVTAATYFPQLAFSQHPATTTHSQHLPTMHHCTQWWQGPELCVCVCVCVSVCVWAFLCTVCI